MCHDNSEMGADLFPDIDRRRHPLASRISAASADSAPSMFYVFVVIIQDSATGRAFVRSVAPHSLEKVGLESPCLREVCLERGCGCGPPKP